MHRKFIAIVTATALSITAIGSAPARADENLLGILAAVAGIAIVGKAISDHNAREKARHSVTRNDYSAPTYRAPVRTYNLKPRPLPQRANRKLLPGDCLRSVDTRQGPLRFFGQRCLELNYKHVNKLPQTCAVNVRGREQKLVARGYSVRCLRNQGYQLARR